MNKYLLAISVAAAATSLMSCTVHIADGMYPPNEFIIESDSAADMLGMATWSNKEQFSKFTPFSTEVIVGHGQRRVFAESTSSPRINEYDPPTPVKYTYDWKGTKKVGLELLNIKFKKLNINANFANTLEQEVTVKIDGIKGKISIGRMPVLISKNICSASGGISKSDPNAYVSDVYKLKGSLTIEVKNFEKQFGFSAKLLDDINESDLNANKISLGIDEQGKGKLTMEFDSLWGIVHATEVSCDSLGPKAPI